MPASRPCRFVSAQYLSDLVSSAYAKFARPLPQTEKQQSFRLSPQVTISARRPEPPWAQESHRRLPAPCGGGCGGRLCMRSLRGRLAGTRAREREGFACRKRTASLGFSAPCLVARGARVVRGPYCPPPEHPLSIMKPIDSRYGVGMEWQCLRRGLRVFLSALVLPEAGLLQLVFLSTEEGKNACSLCENCRIFGRHGTRTHTHTQAILKTSGSRLLACCPYVPDYKRT